MKRWVQNEGTMCDATLIDPVTYWTRLQDRGGLVHCTPDFFHFMKVVEGTLQKLLTKDTLPHFTGKDIIVEVASQLKQSDMILQSFRRLTEAQLASEELSEALLDQMLTCWVGCKTRQVVKQYIFKVKQQKKGNVSRMGENSG